MRLPLLIVVALACANASAEDWFTISGYPELPGTDVIQISPALTTWDHQLTLEVRVTRKADRMGYSGVLYRSYTGMVAVDCDQRKGWFLTLNFFSQPSWQGEPIKTSSFQAEQAPMVFNEIPGNPAMKVITAACAAVR